LHNPRTCARPFDPCLQANYELAALLFSLLIVGGAVSAMPATIVDLGTLDGSQSDSFASGINASGQVVGQSSTAGYTAPHAFLYANGVMKDLGTLGGLESGASGINASGQVVGSSGIAEKTFLGVYHAFLYTNGIMKDLGTLGGLKSFANGINASGQVVGQSWTAGDTDVHAFLYSGGTMRDLNSLLPANSGWVLQNASSINDSGQIVGVMIINGQFHAFLLNPAVGDFDGNGVPDLYWQQDGTNAPAAWYMGGTDGSTILTSKVLRGPQPGWRIAGVSDMNGDGHPDVVWQQDGTGAVNIWYMEGWDGNSILLARSGAAANPGWRVAAVVDMDRNGSSDLVWQQDGTGAVAVSYMGGFGGWSVINYITLSDTNPGWRIVGPH
jgi:probable HAF family extracellular repeat protein